MNKASACLYGTLLLALGTAASAGDFDLFNADRGKPPAQAEPPPPPKAGPPPPVLPKAPPPVQKDFVLRGTQIIGHRRSVILETPNGKRLHQSLRNNEATPINGFPGYVLYSIDPRGVRIGYPSASPCAEDRPDKGVTCKSPGEAELSLQRGKPTPPRMPAAPPMAMPPAQVITVPDMPPGQSNQMTAQPQSFKPRIIKDEEIPPGMKRIRTPFGDRLVPAR